MTPRIIGLCGHYQSGKDTVAKFLGKYGYRRIALADKVREVALAINPILYEWGSEDILYQRLADEVAECGWEGAKRNHEVRRLLQAIGTDAVRNILGQDTWINAIKPAVENSKEKYVISDVRFLNEARWIQNLACGYAFGQVWKVVRPGYEGNDHISEKELEFIEADVIIQNNGTLEDLERTVGNLMEAQCQFSP